MTAIRIIVMRATKTHDLPSGKEGGRHRKGEPVDVYEWNQSREVPSANGSPAFDTIYVSDFPGTLAQARAVLFQRHHINDDKTKGFVARTVRVLDQLTISQARELNDNGFITISHADFDSGMRIRAKNTR